MLYVGAGENFFPVLLPAIPILSEGPTVAEGREGEFFPHSAVAAVVVRRIDSHRKPEFGPINVASAARFAATDRRGGSGGFVRSYPLRVRASPAAVAR